MRYIEHSEAYVDMLEAAQSVAHRLDSGAGSDDVYLLESLARWREKRAAWDMWVSRHAERDGYGSEISTTKGAGASTA